MFGICVFDLKKKTDTLYKKFFLFDEDKGFDERKRTEHRYVTSGGPHGV